MASRREPGGLRIDEPRTAEQMEEYFDLRWRILRAPWGQPRGTEKDDRDAGACHVTARDASGRLLGVGRLHFNDGDEAQIRYMATEEDCRGRGVGEAVARRLEELARARGARRIVLNAREGVAPFYERLGYRAVGPGPTLWGRIRHLSMQKELLRSPSGCRSRLRG